MIRGVPGGASPIAVSSTDRAKSPVGCPRVTFVQSITTPPEGVASTLLTW